MNNEQQGLLNEAYENYESRQINMYIPIWSQEEFIDKCKPDAEFSEQWGLKIEERELSLEERTKILDTKENSNRNTFAEQEGFMSYVCDKHNIPTRLITITYNDTKLESYEMDGKLCYCGNPVDTSNPDCVTFNLCKEHQMDA